MRQLELVLLVRLDHLAFDPIDKKKKRKIKLYYLPKITTLKKAHQLTGIGFLCGGVRIRLASFDLFLTTLLWIAHDTQ